MAPMPDSETPDLPAALAEAATLGEGRAWSAPSQQAVAEARQLLALLKSQPRAPQLQVEADGSIVLEWEVPERGWLQLALHGRGEITHSAVVDGDEFAKSEAFDHTLPPWVAELLRRLLPPAH